LKKGKEAPVRRKEKGNSLFGRSNYKGRNIVLASTPRKRRKLQYTQKREGERKKDQRKVCYGNRGAEGREKVAVPKNAPSPTIARGLAGEGKRKVRRRTTHVAGGGWEKHRSSGNLSYVKGEPDE